jgi:hypothetical protein
MQKFVHFQELLEDWSSGGSLVNLGLGGVILVDVLLVRVLQVEDPKNNILI